MTRAHIVETVEEYNAEGKLIRKTTTETTEESDAKDHWYPYAIPTIPNDNGATPWWATYPPNLWQPTVTVSNNNGNVPTIAVCSSQSNADTQDVGVKQ